jgi:glucose-6-phosphate dehydrogenase assembly protein OpcA
VSLDVNDVVRSLARARQESGAMKTATMTFAVMVENEQMAGWVRERTHAVANKHPSRVIIFDALRDERMQDVESKDSRGEWIELGAKGASAPELQAALSMLELQSAPVVLLWAANQIVSDERFLALARHATATICSSSLTQTDGQGLGDLSAFVNAHPEIALQDIAYLRLASWQELIAEFFDDSKTFGDLHSIERIDVGAGSDAEMYYILGWLASRLEWRAAGAGTFQSPGGTIAFEMHREGPPRRLSRIELRAGKSVYAAAVHPDDQDTICLSVTGPHAKPERCAPLHTVDMASLVERAILRQTRDEVFIESLAMASHILERQKS